MSKFKNALSKSGMALKKHSPAIFTTVGIGGLAVTAVLAYKSRSKVEAVVEEIEEKRENNEEVNKFEVSRKLAEAVALPVTVGVLSCASILMAHKIQNKRIATLASALAAQQARNIYFEKKYREQHGDEEYNKFVAPVARKEVVEVDGKGKEKKTVTEVKAEIDKTIGQWFEDSADYASDDHTYNVAFINSVNEHMQTVLFQRGHLLLNEVLDALGFERNRSGALLGWSTADNFDINKSVVNVEDPITGEIKPSIYVSWTTARYIHDEVDFNGRYSIY